MSRRPRGLQGTWPQALVGFLVPILLVMTVRWVLFEPFVIPSGSMIPNLLVHDHVFVKKFSFGLRWPFTSKWLLQWREPDRGEVVVFRYPDNPEIFYIKRLIGKPGDRVEVNSGRIKVNDIEWALSPLGEDEDGFHLFTETVEGGKPHTVRFRDPRADGEPASWEVPAGFYFFVGDNRDQSSDSRAWGFVPEANLVGPAWFIWMSCDQMLVSARFLCDPATLRFERMFRGVSSYDTE